MAVGETPGQGCQNGSKKFVTISSRKHNEMSSFRLNNGFRLQKTNRAVIRWKQPPQKPFHHVSRDKILHDSWSISAALARGFSDRHFERGEEVVELYDLQFCFLCFNSLLHTGSIRKTKRKIGGVGVGGNRKKKKKRNSVPLLPTSPPTCIYPPLSLHSPLQGKELFEWKEPENCNSLQLSIGKNISYPAPNSV